MAESLLEELKRYVGFGAADEASLRELHPLAQPHFQKIAEGFYDLILSHEGASKALRGGESTVGRLKVTLVAWMDKLLLGPWDEDYYELRCRIGRVHVRIALPQHYMFGAMNFVRGALQELVDAQVHPEERRQRVSAALDRILDLELAIMLHTYREDLLAQQSRIERLSTFGQLVGSIGHELRNPLGVIESSLFILQGRVGVDERAQKHIKRISDQVTVANQIVTSLLDMIRDRPLAQEALRLEETANDAVHSVSRPEGVEIHLQGLQGLVAKADPVQLRQVLVNLLENAIHAASPKGEVWLFGQSGAESVELRIEDSGPGADPSVLPRLFEPLITTKAKGIGLGLALVKRIVERHGGTIRYAPAPRGGAGFTVVLPKG
jgi:signal transduction histidine kinase